MGAIKAVSMPKWGLSMEEGMVVQWWKAPGEAVAEGEDLVDIETSKITNTAEAPASGVLRRIVAPSQEPLPVGALLAVIADAAVSDQEVDRFVAAFAAEAEPQTEATAGEPALRLETVSAAGRTLRVGRVAGEGVPIVLLHGFASDLGAWLLNLDALRTAGPVIALDLPGHGASSKDVGDGGLAVLAGATGAALDVLGHPRAHLVGHSLGAATAARLALDRPRLAQSLTLIAPVGLPGVTPAEDFLTGLVEAQRARDLEPLLERLVANPGLVGRDMVENVLRYKRLDGVEEALSRIRDRILEGGDFADLAPGLPRLPSALVVLGAEDAIVSPPDGAALPPDWRVVSIPGAAHMPHLEKAAEVNALLLETIGG